MYEKDCPYTEPQLYTAGGKLDAQWFVFYSYRNPKTKKLVRFKVYGFLSRYKTSNARFREAAALLKAVAITLADGRLNPFGVAGKEPLNLLEQLEQSLNFMRQSLRPASITTYELVFKAFKRYLFSSGQEEATEASTEMICGFRDLYVLKGKLSAAHLYCGALKSLMQHAIERTGGSNPWLKIKLPKVPQAKTNRGISAEDAEKIIALARERYPKGFEALVLLIYSCFLRPKEIVNLKVAQLEGSLLWVPAEIAKNKKKAAVTLPSRFFELYDLSEAKSDDFLFGKNYAPGPFQLDSGQPGRDHKKLLNELTLIHSGYSLYSWKETGVIAAIKAGIHSEAIFRQLRHTDRNMIAHYTKTYGQGEMPEFKLGF